MPVTLAAHLAQYKAAMMEELVLMYWEEVCWRMYGYIVEWYGDEILVYQPK